MKFMFFQKSELHIHVDNFIKWKAKYVDCIADRKAILLYFIKYLGINNFCEITQEGLENYRKHLFQTHSQFTVESNLRCIKCFMKYVKCFLKREDKNVIMERMVRIKREKLGRPEDTETIKMVNFLYTMDVPEEKKLNKSEIARLVKKDVRHVRRLLNQGLINKHFAVHS